MTPVSGLIRGAIVADMILVFASAAPASSTNSAWSVHAWQMGYGLPNKTLNSLAQTPDGYLWERNPYQPRGCEERRGRRPGGRLPRWTLTNAPPFRPAHHSPGGRARRRHLDLLRLPAFQIRRGRKPGRIWLLPAEVHQHETQGHARRQQRRSLDWHLRQRAVSLR